VWQWHPDDSPPPSPFNLPSCAFQGGLTTTVLDPKTTSYQGKEASLSVACSRMVNCRHYDIFMSKERVGEGASTTPPPITPQPQTKKGCKHGVTQRPWVGISPCSAVTSFNDSTRSFNKERRTIGARGIVRHVVSWERRITSWGRKPAQTQQRSWNSSLWQWEW